VSISVRYYLFTEQGLQRISKRLMEGLCRGRDAMPQFAGTNQKIVEVFVELESKKPLRMRRVTGSYLRFDGKGLVHSLANGAIEALDTYRDMEAAKRAPPSKIVDLTPQLNRRKWEREYRWEPSEEQLDLIEKDIWKATAGPKS